ncbi:MAG: hypothetical protein IPL40_11575 [Proteobacteria bacterium]|nr:hypothetical protein [Pseudomonadota bacterium]
MVMALVPTPDPTFDTAAAPRGAALLRARRWKRALFVLLAAALLVTPPLLLWRARARRPPAPRVLRFGPLRLVAALAVQATVAAAGRGGALAVGTREGGVLLTNLGGGRALPPRWLLPPAGAAAVLDGPVTALAFSADGRRLLAAGGRAIGWWQVDPPRLLGQLRGPQAITAAVLAPGDAGALFGTDQGFVQRWRLDRREAEPAAGLGCELIVLEYQRARLPLARRCPFGTFVQTHDLRPACAYPLTQLTRRGALLAQACRTGTASLITLPQGATQHTLAGALGALAFDPRGRLLLARADGELRLYDPTARAVVRVWPRAGEARALAAADDLAALAGADGSLRLWDLRAAGDAPPSATLRLPRPPVWLALEAHPLRLRALLDDGRLVEATVAASLADGTGHSIRRRPPH